MAVAMKSIVNEVKDITECSICTEMFNNPKMLPCFHTFCLKCIEQYCKDKKEGDTMPCPMCRKEFIVPSGGMSKLSVNFFIERLIAIQSVSTSSSNVVNCDVCLAGKQCIVEASNFCMECQENMCDPCSIMHKGMKMSKHHQLSTIGDPSTMEAIKNKIRRTFCDKHPTKVVKFFCRDCKITFCTTCFIGKHNKHECCEVREIVEEFKKGFRAHFDDVSELLTTFEKQSDLVDKQLASFTIRTDTAEKDILERSEAIKQMVDMHTQALIAELESHKTHFLKNHQTSKEELQRCMMMCQNFVSYCRKAIEEADAVESVRIAEELKTRADELEELFPKLNKLPEIKFRPLDLDVSTKLDNIVGNIIVKYSMKFVLQGFEISNDELFVIRPRSVPGIPDIRVFNIDPLYLKRRIVVEDMMNPYDIVAGENVLYISECEDKLIHRIQLPEETVSNWTVDGTWLKLSISKYGNVMAASWNPANILEFTSDGTFIRKIVVDQINKILFGLQHAIQLEGDKILVCYSTTNHHRVCLLNSMGRVIKCYGGMIGSGMENLNMPSHLAILRDGCILVADEKNNRIVQLDASLKYMKEFTSFEEPRRLRLNEELGRLYVIENNDNRSVSILDMSLGVPRRLRTPSPAEQSRSKRLRSPSRSPRADESSKMSRKESPHSSRSRQEGNRNDCMNLTDDSESS